MTGPTPPDATARRPAVIVGGRRRRLVRRTGLPRSQTTPTLDLESATASEESTAATTLGTNRSAAVTEPTDTTPTTTQDDSQFTMNFYSPHGGLPADYRPSYKSRPPTGPPSIGLAAQSPTPGAANAANTTPKSKKKHGLFNLKLKEGDRPKSSHDSTVTSPIPPTTPAKAVQFLGLKADAIKTGSSQLGRGQNNGVSEDPLVRPRLKKQSSMPLLTKIKDIAARETKFKEEGVAPDPPKSKKFWDTSNMKAKRLLDLLPLIGVGPKRASDDPLAASSSSLTYSEGNTEHVYRSDGGQYSHPDLPLTARRPGPSRRTRKKVPKSLDRMSIITEASHDEPGVVYRDSEHDDELEVISEYEHPAFPPRSASLLPRSHTEYTLTSGVDYELDDDDLSPTDYVDEEEEAEEETTQVDLSQLKWQHPTTVPSRGPLQMVENRLLDVTEEDMRRLEATMKQHDVADLDDPEGHVARLQDAVNKNDATKLHVDAAVADLRASHEKMKSELEASKQRAIAFDQPDHVCDAEHSDDDDEDDDLVSLRSSIDLEEEPTVHVAKEMTFTRITPGMVKLVDIPPRKKKDPIPTAPATTAASTTTNGRRGL